MISILILFLLVLCALGLYVIRAVMGVKKLADIRRTRIVDP
jgi:hypothetical protein